jgi:hypothetical protein
MSVRGEEVSADEAALGRLLRSALEPTAAQETAIFTRLMVVAREEAAAEEQRAWLSFAAVMSRIGGAVGQIVNKAAFQPLWMTSLSTAR